MEIKKIIQTVKINFKCPECKKGFMFPTGEIEPSETVLEFEHKCESCGDKRYLPAAYPIIREEQIEEKFNVKPVLVITISHRYNERQKAEYFQFVSRHKINKDYYILFIENTIDESKIELLNKEYSSKEIEDFKKDFDKFKEVKLIK